MPPRDVFEGGPTREQQERLEAQTGGRRGSTRGRSDQDPRSMYGDSREQTGTVTVDLGEDRGGTIEVPIYGGPTQQINTGFDFGTGEKAGTLSQQEFMNITGRTATNPYGNEGFFSRVFGLDPSKINYAASTPGGIATLNQVNALAYDQYLNPRDAQGNIRGMLREGSPTRSGTVVYDPTMETDLGIMGAIPYVGGLMRMANRRSALNISPYDNPLFSDMSDMGNELGAFPPPADEIAAAGKAAAEASFTNTPIPTADELIAQAYQDESLLQGPPQLQMDEITAGGVNTIQGMLDFPGTQQDRRFEASSSGTDRRGGEDLLRGYLERFPLYQ